MDLKFYCHFLLFFLFYGSQANEIIDLKTEYLTNPIGIDVINPRFSWKIKSSEHYNSHYHLVVGTDSSEVAMGIGKYWSTKFSNYENRISYAGKKLDASTKYYWAIAKDTTNSKKVYYVSSFATGLWGISEWKGNWITDTSGVNLKPAPYFRKEVSINKVVAAATAYITAAGLFEFYINGKKIGDHFLDPVYTRFDKRNTYVTFDVTPHFKTRKIALGILLGNGWYNHQSTAVWNFDKAGWRNRPRFLLNIKVDYTDGSSEIIRSDSSWKTSLSPVIFNSIYTAEHVDARLDQKGWNMPGFNNNSWENAIPVAAPSSHIVAQSIQPIRLTDTLKPVSLKKINDTSYVYDMGRNISGITQLKVEGKGGTTFQVTHAEQLDSIGNVDLTNINVHYRPTNDSDPFQTDIYTLSGDGLETFSPKFNYKGFQYVRVTSDQPFVVDQESLTGYFAHSDVPQTGTIKSSNEIINKIWEATNAAYLSNLFGYPTDCPQREKNGWTGDAHINIETGLYNFDAITIYEKWMADHRDEQQPNGVLPSIIPTWGWGYDWGNGPDWTSTIAIIPWELYQFYGDDTALIDNYEAIKKYVDHITETSRESGLTDWGLGDWVPVKSVTPKEFTSSIYYFVDATILAKTAKHLKKEEDYEFYSTLATDIRNAINLKYLDRETGVYGQGFQTELSAALYWDIVPEDLRSKVAENLYKRVLADDKHIDVGLLGTKTILGALSENGYADLAYEVASQETFPSWGWWIKNGATTLYENWDIAATSDISRNHIMFGAIGAWLYKGIGGIYPDPNAPGFKNVLLKPNFVTGLDTFTAKHTGPFGEIVSSWKRDGSNVIYTVVIPPNSTGTLQLYNVKSFLSDVDKGKVNRSDDLINTHLIAGTYVFKIELK
ncbi:alpha-L-rhamnosidase [Leeuwenhoekiella aequorea]|uniref:alpha-L-rhamnosidase n=1 Tax=Leeuwenhoekiella aequorea TaxID=283736 RepID=A0A4Q0P6F3_9FLAO|nr:alpha-L-rhamnosidase [Leeuwenhoekiella aequorea]RXG21239.1 alpha-L-rhamnosidase [Leeuwenhoekiella aequorea]